MMDEPPVYLVEPTTVRNGDGVVYLDRDTLIADYTPMYMAGLPRAYKTTSPYAVFGATDQSKIFESNGSLYIPENYVKAGPKSKGLFANVMDTFGPVLAAAGLGSLLGGAAFGGEAVAAGAVDYSLTAGGIPSLGATTIGAGESLSVYGASGLTGTGFASLGTNAVGGLISGAAATSAGWWLPSAGDAYRALKSGSSAVNTAAKLTGAGGASAPILAKGNGMESLKLGNNLAGVSAPMTSNTAVSSPLSSAFGGADTTKAVIIGAVLVGMIYLLTKGGK